MRRSLVTSVTALLVWGTAAFAADPLPSWNDGTLWAEQPIWKCTHFSRWHATRFSNRTGSAGTMDQSRW